MAADRPALPETPEPEWLKAMAFAYCGGRTDPDSRYRCRCRARCPFYPVDDMKRAYAALRRAMEKADA